MANINMTEFQWVTEANATESQLGLLTYLKELFGEVPIDYTKVTGKYSRCEVTTKDTSMDWVLPVIIVVVLLLVIGAVAFGYLYYKRTQKMPDPSALRPVPVVSQLSRLDTTNFLSVGIIPNTGRGVAPPSNAKFWKVV
jgi:hypothetical protein